MDRDNVVQKIPSDTETIKKKWDSPTLNYIDTKETCSGSGSGPDIESPSP